MSDSAYIVNLPKVIFGTSGLGNLYVALDESSKRDIIQECIRHSPGLTVFDTAGKYGAGLALEALGNCLRQLNVKKEDVLISNKLGWYRIPLRTEEPTFEPGVWRDIHHDAEQRISYDGILECFEQGNELLNGYDTAFASVHDPDEYMAAAVDEKDAQDRFQNIRDAYRALFELKAKGKVKAIGVGAKNWHFIKKITDEIHLDWVMIANSMTLHSHPQDLADYMKTLAQNNVAIMNSAVFNGGFLTGGEYYNYKLVTDKDPAHRRLLEWRRQFFLLCEKHHIQPAHACVQFALHVPGVTSIAMSTSKASKVKGNVEMATIPIADAFWEEMTELMNNE